MDTAIKIIFLSGPIAGHRFAVDHDITIGRDPSNDISIPDTAVSLVHCQVAFEEEAVSIKDLGSTNGIRVSGARVITQELKHGDSLLIGKSLARIESLVPSQKGAQTSSAPGESGSAETEEDLSGNIFGSVTYYLKRKIADGGMGSIYEAEQFGAEGFIKQVAIKTIRPAFVEKESFVSSFIGEAKLVANLVHPNIVQIHHLGRHERGYYIAMEYIDGVDLSKFINTHYSRRTSIPVGITLLIMHRVCLGLDYAHCKVDRKGHLLNLVHRDVSPSNVMLTREGEVKLTDFGVAQAAHFMEDDGSYLVGSVEYMSPEQAVCDAVDGRSDLFSLGLLGYELLTNDRLLQVPDHDTDAAIQHIMKMKIPDCRDKRPDLPDDVAEIIKKCLQKNRNDRYSSAQELGAIIEEAMHRLGPVPMSQTLARYLSTLGLLPERTQSV